MFLSSDQVYQSALAKIEQTKKAGSKYLKLADLGLESLPPEIGELTSLTSLYLNSNQLTSLPPEICLLTNLTGLDLGENQLTKLPQGFGQLENLTELYLHSNQLSSFPSEICRFSNLTVLALYANQLSALPSEIRQLLRLAELYLYGNQLTRLPVEIGDLSNLNSLDLSRNQLGRLPSEIGNLSSLTELWLQNNRLGRLPSEIGQLTNLTELWLRGNKLAKLPTEICQLGRLTQLYLGDNHLVTLPPEICQLENLSVLDLDGNPLSFPPAEIRTEGFKAIQSFLHSYSLRKIDRYEGKLLILGDGGEGKTCLSRALRGLPYQEQSTTHGVAVCSWVFENPVSTDNDNRITLNVWDFEGQEINHQSHQLFLTKRSLYLLVFKGREYIKLSRLEYWLDTIRHRAPHCKVLLVATECEGRTPLFAADQFISEYPDLLPENPYYMVDSKSGKNIEALRSRIISLACDMELMPQSWPGAYQDAESSLIALSQELNYIKRADLESIFEAKGLPADAFDSTARVFGDLGIFTHFPDSIEMKSRIVLNPQWLTKAISLALEDPSLSSHKGEMDHDRLLALWEDNYAGHFDFFYACMKHFELCFPLDENMSLIPLRFPYERPPIPWSQIPGASERRVEYRFIGNPPAGLISRFIVKTHNLIAKTEDHLKGVYWRNGVFLEINDPHYRAQALCEMEDEARLLRVTVQAAYPQNFISQLDGFVHAVFSFFEGFQPTRFFGCIQEDGKPCEGSFEDRSVKLHFEKERSLLCSKSRHEVNPQELLHGLHCFAPAKAADKGVQAILARMNEQARFMVQLQERQSVMPDDVFQRIQQGYRELMNLMDTRDLAQIPGIATLTPVDFKDADLSERANLKLRIRFWCEHESQPHYGQWTGELDHPKELWSKLLPYLLPVVRVLTITSTPAFSAIPLAPDLEAAKLEMVSCGRLLQSLAKLGTGKNWGGLDADSLRRSGRMEAQDGLFQLARLEMSNMIRLAFPIEADHHDWQGIRRYNFADNTFRWLCAEHQPTS